MSAKPIATYDINVRESPSVVGFDQLTSLVSGLCEQSLAHVRALWDAGVEVHVDVIELAVDGHQHLHGFEDPWVASSTLPDVVEVVKPVEHVDVVVAEIDRAVNFLLPGHATRLGLEGYNSGGFAHE